MGRTYWPACTALCAFCTEKRFTFLNSSCPYLLDNMHLTLVQPLYRARISLEYARISIEGTVRSCIGGRYWPAITDLYAFCTEKGFTFINSSCPYLLDNIHLALVQPFFRARISRECMRISIVGIYYTALLGTEILAGPYSFVRLLHRERVSIFKLFMPIAS